MKRWPGGRPTLRHHASTMGIMMATTGVLFMKAEMMASGNIIRMSAPAAAPAPWAALGVWRKRQKAPERRRDQDKPYTAFPQLHSAVM